MPTTLGTRAAGVAALLAAAACLPEAGPGVGTQLIADRSIAEAALSPGENGVIVYGRLPPPEDLLATEHPSELPRELRLRFHAVPVTGGASLPLDLDRTTIINGIHFLDGVGWNSEARLCFPEQRVRLEVCLDPRTGKAERFRARSRDGMVELLATDGDEDRLLLRDEHATTHDLGPARGTAVFRGRDLYWIGVGPAGEQMLQRFRAGEVQTLATNVNAVTPLTELPDGPLLVKLDGTEAGRDWHAFDPVRRSRVRLVDSGLGNSSQPVASFDGMWVVFTFEPLRVEGPPGPVELHAYRLSDGVALHTSVTGTQARYSVDFQPRMWLRPRSHEAWIAYLGQLTVVDLDSGRVGASTSSTARYEGSHPFVVGTDGSYAVVARRDASAGRIGTWVVPADAPDAAGVQIAAGFAAVHTVRAVTSSGLIATVSIRDTSRRDAYFIDLVSGSRRHLAERIMDDPFVDGGRVLLRARGLPTGVGELTLFDFAAGTEVLLARNVRSVSLQPACSTCGLLAPGARMAYVVHAGRPSPHDGLWIATLP